jgi:S-adenosylmethionine decarboxylase
MSNQNNGFHIIMSLKTRQNELLLNFDDFDIFIKKLFNLLDIEIVGKASHIFENNSFTGVYCLKESHLNIHTWPEYQLINFDVYLCNYSKINTSITEKIANEVVNYFDAQILQSDKIFRL